MKATKLQSGSYRVQFRIGDRRLSVTRPTEREAIQEALAAQAAARIEDSHPEIETIGEIVDKYIAHRTASGRVSPSTLRGYKQARENSFPRLMQTQIGRATRAMYQKAVDTDTRSPKTVKNAWGLVHAAIRWRTGQDIHIELPQPERNDHPFLDSDQVLVFLTGIRGKGVEAPALLGLHSLRRSEISALNWEDVDLEADVIHVHGAVVYGPDGKLVKKAQNKTALSRRDVPIMIERLRELRRAADPKAPVCEMLPGSIRKQVNKVCEDLGLPLIGTHGLRHSFASLAHYVGMPPEVAMKIGGWADFQTMRKIYTHIEEKSIKKHTKSIENLFDGNGIL